MREIKFRAKGIRENKDKWFVGSLFVEDGMGITYIVSGVNTHYETNYLQVEVDSQTVGEFTGLKDSEGREIYEGDIVASDSGRLRDPVRWDAKRAVYVIGKTLVLGDFYKLVRVIGNVSDNPELLEAAE